ncbi:FtsK/SpoIIIE domain-containing protein [Butyrivibrio sp. FCS014]|uniref:FtsK/SpoIIIE domain-containing protein n=1 Tax=Butyrivibrio sp. FCS014 TaxID=1408304 RepID=UPI000465586F|nr:FtsK/SpoIIIE domain-containing protein [Butyrivibrio sp. FCS014]
MQTLIEQYNEIFQKISGLNGQISGFEAQIQELENLRDGEIPERIKNLEDQLTKIDEYQLKISGFIQLAEDHMTSKNLLSIEAPDGYRVNIKRLRDWASLIDPLAEDDVYAQKVYLVANCDLKFLEQKKAEFTARIQELKDDLAVGAPEQLKELNQKIDAVREQIREFLESDQFSSFADNVRSENEAHMYQQAPEKYVDHDSDPELWIPGAYGTAIDVVDSQREHLKLTLGRFYDEKNSKVYLPLYRIKADEEFAMSISCVPARKKMNEMDAGIRNLLFQIIDRSPAGSRKIYVIDALRQNSALIGGLRGLEGTDVLEPVPRNEEQMLQTLENIVAGFSDIDDMLEGYDTVLEYNNEMPAEKRMQRSVIVVVGWPKEIKGEAEERIKKIFSNYERYGISFIAVKVAAVSDKSNNDDSGFSDYIGESMINIKMTMKETTIQIGQEDAHSFAWYPFKFNLSSDYCTAVRNMSKGKGQKVTDYAERGLLDGGINYTRGNKLLNLPYGVDGKDKLHSIVFENENFASFLMGASGSGKSTFLHSLITGIIKNYHPDDVELWLADFKMSEFAQYIDPRPPHVKYILLDESKELIFDLIDKLTDKMMERQRYFMRNREYKKVEKVPVEEYMPVIFVILDEFSIMSQAIQDNEQYKLKLQNLLAKGRALGIKFLFSSQTFTTGVRGLTDTAKAQIQMRIAMKAAKDEIVETMELSSSQKTDQVQNWIDALPVYHALIKYRDKSEDGEDRVLVRRTTVLYFDDKDSPGDPYRKQRDLINACNDMLRPVDKYNPNELNVYVDKDPVMVDGNTYYAYTPEFLKERKHEYRIANKLEDDEMLVAFGRPRLMSDIRFATVTAESRENFLLFAPVGEQMCAASILVSIIKQFKQTKKNVEIWTYARSRIFKNYAEVFKAQNCEVVADTYSISKRIWELKKDILAKKSEDKLIVLLGMERICGDFGYDDGGAASSASTELTDSDLNELFHPEGQDVDMSTLDEEDWKNTRYSDKIMEYEAKCRQDNPNLTDDEVNQLLQEADDRIYNEVIEEWDNMSKGISAPSAEVKAEDAAAESTSANTAKAVESEDKPKEDEMPEKYNAMNDFKEILMKGSRYGYHFALYLSNFADLKATSFSLDYFRHRLSFQLNPDDSWQLFNSKVAASLPEHVCQYYDTLEGFSFRPYLHQGIDWDGWGISEDGEIISPMA